MPAGPRERCGSAPGMRGLVRREGHVNGYRAPLIAKRDELVTKSRRREDSCIVQSNEQIETVQLAGQGIRGTLWSARPGYASSAKSRFLPNASRVCRGLDIACTARIARLRRGDGHGRAENGRMRPPDRASRQNDPNRPASSVCPSTRQATPTPNLGICFGARRSVLGDGLSGFRSPCQ